MNKRKRYSTGAAGFSAPELLIVMAIVGVLAGIGIPNFLRSLPERRLANVARTLYADFQKARLFAVRNNTNAMFSFTPAINPPTDHPIYTYDDVGGNGVDGNTTVRDLTEYGAVRYGCDVTNTDWNDVALAAGTKVTFTNNEVRFTSRGLAEMEDDLGKFEMLAQADADPDHEGEERVYLQSENDRSVCFAVTLTSFGAAKIRKFSDGKWK